jgi:predicted GIY-YIG superfamily endonuclease
MGAKSKDPEDDCATMPLQGVLAWSISIWIYIMASLTGTLYIGVIGELYIRVMQHKTGEVEGFPQTYRCSRLVYHKSFDDVHKAIARENN